MKCSPWYDLRGWLGVKNQLSIYLVKCWFVAQTHATRRANSQSTYIPKWNAFVTCSHKRDLKSLETNTSYRQISDGQSPCPPPNSHVTTDCNFSIFLRYRLASNHIYIKATFYVHIDDACTLCVFMYIYYIYKFLLSLFISLTPDVKQFFEWNWINCIAHRIVLYCIVLYCIVLYCIILYCTVFQCQHLRSDQIDLIRPRFFWWERVPLQKPDRALHAACAGVPSKLHRLINWLL